MKFRFNISSKKYTLIGLFFLLTLCSVKAQTTYTWIGETSTSWSESSNWSPTGVPDTVDHVIIQTGSTHDPLLDGSKKVANFTMNSGSVSMGASYTITITGEARFLGGALTGNGFVKSNNNAYTLFQGTAFDPEVDMRSRTILLKGSTFYNDVRLNLTSNATGLEAGIGGNTFEKDLYLTISGGGASLYFHQSADDIFKGDIYLSSSSSGSIVFGKSSGGGQGTLEGVFKSLGTGLGSTSLYLYNFAQQGTLNTADKNRITSGNGNSNIFIGRTGTTGQYACTFGSQVTLQAGDIVLKKVHFQDTTSLTKIWVHNRPDGIGGNTFEKALYLRNTQTGTLYFHQSADDIFKGDIYLSSSSSGSIVFGKSSGGGQGTLEGVFKSLGTGLGSTYTSINLLSLNLFLKT